MSVEEAARIALLLAAPPPKDDVSVVLGRPKEAVSVDEVLLDVGVSKPPVPSSVDVVKVGVVSLDSEEKEGAEAVVGTNVATVVCLAVSVAVTVAVCVTSNRPASASGSVSQNTEAHLLY